MVIWRPLKRFLIAAVLSVPVLTFAGLPVPVSKSVDLLTAAGQKFGRVQSSVDDHISSQSDETCGHHYFGSTAPRINSRSEEHTSELQSLMRISYAVFCFKKKKKTKHENKQ